MTIKIRGGSFQVDFVHGGSRYRRQFQDRLSAEAWEINAKSRLIRGLGPDEETEVKDRGPTFRAVAEQVWDLVWQHQKSAAKTRSRLNIVLQDMDDEPLIADITKSWLDEYGKYLIDRGNSGGTVNRKLALISKVLNFAYDHGHIDRVPRFHHWPESEGRMRWYTEEEEQMILNACEDQESVVLMTLLFDTGMRLGEALKLHTDDVDFEQGIISLYETKNSQPRTIPMTERVKSVLRGRTGVGLTEGQVNARWRKIKKKLGWGRGDCIHAIRHTFVSRLVQRGVDLDMAGVLAGHKSGQTTRRYRHLKTDNLKVAIQKLETCAQ